MELTVHHKLQRRRWVNQHLNWNIRNWQSVLFSGESRFNLKFADGRIRVWRQKGEQFHQRCVMQKDRFGGGSLMVWGGIHYHEKTDLVIIRGNLNSQEYCDNVVRPVVLPFFAARPAFQFQHDNARPHTARITTTLLQTNAINVMPWPSRSPDLNPIEHVRDLLNRRVRSNNANINNLQEVRTALIAEWNAIPQRQIQKKNPENDAVPSQTRMEDGQGIEVCPYKRTSLL
jgi:hypothetical protein